MPSTTTTTEVFPAGTEKTYVEGERDLRLQAGAITSKFTGSKEEGWELVTVWNVIGGTDE